MVIENKLLWNMGMVIDFKNELLDWDGDKIPLKINGAIQDENICQMLYSMHTDAPIIQEAEERAERILDADYSKVNIDEMVDELKIDKDLKGKLKMTLNKFPTLFGGGLGKLSDEFPRAKIKLKKGAKPHAATYYTLPHAQRGPARKEVDHMVAVGILKKLEWHDDTPWAAPSFSQPKKTGDLQIVTDFRKMNESIKQHLFPILKIIDTMQDLNKFKSETALDLSQGFYTIPLDKESQKICTTVTPWGKYAHLRMPMGIASAPDMFQSIMNEILGDLPYVLVYINDVLCLQEEGKSAKDHLKKLETNLGRLEKAGF